MLQHVAELGVVAFLVQDVEGDHWALHICMLGVEVVAVDQDHRLAIGVLEGAQAIAEVPGQCPCVVLDRGNRDPLDAVQPDPQGRDGQEGQGAVLKLFRALLEVVVVHLAGRGRHAAPTKVRLLQVLVDVLLEEEGADPRGVPEDLVEGHRDEVRLVLRQVQWGIGGEGGSVEEHEPVFACCPLEVGDQLQGVLGTVEVVLPWEGKEGRALWQGPPTALEEPFEVRQEVRQLVIGDSERLSALTLGVFANAQDGVVVTHGVDVR
mmetsp:Transcript_7680/g.13598  ORF Transcript_7680/g.13598 Transcript_7680/m.13598 type:complete len:264 (-) Transcript_7680:1885-2676(-)